MAEVLAEAEIPTTSLMTHLPQYVQLDEDHMGASRLLQVLTAVYGFPTSLADTSRGEQQYLDISRAVENKPEVKTLIAQFEKYYDKVLSGVEPEGEVSFAPDVERFLSEMGDRLEENQNGRDDD